MQLVNNTKKALLLFFLCSQATVVKTETHLSASLEAIKTLSPDWEKPLAQEVRQEKTNTPQNTDTTKEDQSNNNKIFLARLGANFVLGCGSIALENKFRKTPIGQNIFVNLPMHVIISQPLSLIPYKGEFITGPEAAALNVFYAAGFLTCFTLGGRSNERL